VHHRHFYKLSKLSLHLSISGCSNLHSEKKNSLTSWYLELRIYEEKKAVTTSCDSSLEFY